jgi:hypothetical protein
MTFRLLPVARRRARHHAPGAAALVALVGAMTLLVATPAAAHPFLRGGGEVPVDSSATITLDLAHGCGSEADGTGEDTLEVALEVPSWLRVLAVAEHPAYRHDLEMAAEGRVAVVTWTAVGAGEPAPAFALDVVATGTAGETRHLAVFQGCDDRSHRWIGTPQEPADDPAVNVRLTAADPARPAPPEVGSAEQPPEAPREEGSAEPPPEAPTAADDPESDPDPDSAPDTDARDADPAPADPAAAAASAMDATDAQDEPDGGDGLLSTPGGIGLLVAAVLAAGLIVLTLVRRGRRATAGDAPS